MEKSSLFKIGMVWYYREDYDAILRIMTDSHKLPESFDIWLAEAEQDEDNLTAGWIYRCAHPYRSRNVSWLVPLARPECRFRGTHGLRQLHCETKRKK